MSVHDRRLLCAVSLAACGPSIVADDSETSGDTESATSATTFLSSTTSATTSSGTTTSASTTDAESTSTTESRTTEDPCPFIWDPDVAATPTECDLWAQNCPVGEKCMPWANDGGSSWNAARCSPLDPNPDAPGDACTVEGSGVSGIDSCDATSMCWDVDPDTNVGTCVSFCTGSKAQPVCNDTATYCQVSNNDVLILCLPICDPLLQDCPRGHECQPREGIFVCGLDFGKAGTYGDACDVWSSVCDPGLFCASPETVPGCTDEVGCCSEFCDLLADVPDAQCSGQAEGQICVPYFDEGGAPPGLAHVGACSLPP